MKRNVTHLFFVTFLFLAVLIVMPVKFAHATSSIPVGNEPESSVVLGTNLYVINQGSGTVSVIDANPSNTTYNTVTDTISLGSADAGPSSIVAYNGKLYVTDQPGGVGSVSIITAADNSVVTVPISGGGKPIFSVISNLNSYLYILNNNNNTISMLDTSNNTIVGTITITDGTSPIQGVISGNTGRQLAVLLQSGKVALIDIDPTDIGTTYNQVVATVDTGTSPTSITAQDSKVYVTNSGSSNVTAIDTLTDTSFTVSVAANPTESIVVGTNLYVICPDYTPNNSLSNISVIDISGAITADTVTHTISSLGYSLIAPVAYNGLLYVLSANNGETISAIDLNTNTDISDTHPIGSFPNSMTLVGHDLYVNNTGAANVTVYDTTTKSVLPVPPPVLQAATIYDHTLTLAYDEQLYSANTPAKADFSVSVNGIPDMVTGVTISPVNTVALDLADPLPSNGVPVTVTYDPTGDTWPIQDLGNNVAVGFSGQSVQDQYVVTYTAGANGTINGQSSVVQYVNVGSSSTSVNAQANNGYTFTNWSDTQSTSTARQDTNVKSDISATANFAIQVTPPIVATHAATNVGKTTATLSATITALGGANATLEAFHYIPYATLVADQQNHRSVNLDLITTSPISGLFGAGSNFSTDITGLTCDTQYVYQGFASSPHQQGNGGSGGQPVYFTTASCVDQPTPQASTPSPYVSGGGFLNESQKQAALAALSGTTSSGTTSQEVVTPTVPVTPVAFTGKLRYGTRNASVTTLQKYLNSHNYIITKTGPGSPGHENNYFGLLTKKAVMKFQSDHGLNPDGVVGVKTWGLMK